MPYFYRYNVFFTQARARAHTHTHIHTQNSRKFKIIINKYNKYITQHTLQDCNTFVSQS